MQLCAGEEIVQGQKAQAQKQAQEARQYLVLGVACCNELITSCTIHMSMNVKLTHEAGGSCLSVSRYRHQGLQLLLIFGATASGCL